MFLLAHWKATALATAGTLLAGYIALLNVQLASERATVAMLDADLRTEQGKYRTCNARLTNILERIESDSTVPDDLGGFIPPDTWLLPFLDGTSHPGD